MYNFTQSVWPIYVVLTRIQFRHKKRVLGVKYFNRTECLCKWNDKYGVWAPRHSKMIYYWRNTCTWFRVRNALTKSSLPNRQPPSPSLGSPSSPFWTPSHGLISSVIPCIHQSQNPPIICHNAIICLSLALFQMQWCRCRRLATLLSSAQTSLCIKKGLQHEEGKSGRLSGPNDLWLLILILPPTNASH